MFQHCINYWWTHSFLFELSISRLFNHVLLCIIEKLLSFKLIIYMKYRHSQTFLSSEPLSPHVFTLKGWSTSYFQRLDCVYGATVKIALLFIYFTTVSVLLTSWFDEAPPSEIHNGLRLVSWSSVLWLCAPGGRVYVNFSVCDITHRGRSSL